MATTADTLSPLLPHALEQRTLAVLKTACDRDLTLATAESCTGGLIASLLTDVEGKSHAFDRGFVAYTNEAKEALLGVDPALLDRCGAVSKPVAIAMAEGALTRSEADIAVSVTGFAGKGKPGEEPGLVHFGCARKGQPTRHHEAHFGDIGRGGVRIACVETAMAMIEEALG